MTNVDACGGMLTKMMGLCAMGEILREARIVDYVISHPIQTFAILEVLDPIEVVSRPGAIKDLPKGELPMSFMGLRVIADTHFPEDRIEFRNAQHETICVLKNLAVPRPNGDQ